MRALVILLAACQATAVPVEDAGVSHERLVLTGTLAATNATELVVPVTDESTLTLRWLVEDGTVVKAGDRIAELDATPFLTRLREDQTQLASAETQFRLAQRSRGIQLADKQFAVRQNEIARDKARLRAEVPADLVAARAAHTSQSLLARAESDLRAAQADLATTTATLAIEERIRVLELDKTRASIEMLNATLAKLVLVAPRDGIVQIGRNPSENRMLRVGDTAEQGQVVARQPDLARPMEVLADLADIDDGRVTIGDAATCTLDAYPGEPLACTVTALSPIARAPSRDSLRRTFAVRLALGAGDPTHLRPGLSVKVALGTAVLEPLPRDDVRTVEVAGELASIETVDVKTPAFREPAYFTISWLAPEGAVEAGATIAKFDDSELRRNIDSTTADVAEAKQQLERRRAEVVLARRAEALRILEAEAGMKRATMKGEVPKSIVAAIDMRSQELDIELARIALVQAKRSAAFATSSDETDLRDLVRMGELAKRRLAEQQQNLTRLAVVAPRAGTLVHSRKVGDGIYQGNTVAQIVSLETMVGLGHVDEVDLSRLRTGATVTLRLDALPDVQLRGTLAAITGEVHERETDPSKVVRVRLAIGENGALLRPGMHFHGAIEVQP